MGATVHTLDVSFDGGYRVDLDQLRSLLSTRTKLVSLASPQNPSGVEVPQDTIASIVTMMSTICPEAYLLIDETYREGAYGNEPERPSAVTYGPKTVVCASLSKCHGAPGLRLGWAITQDKDLRDQ